MSNYICSIYVHTRDSNRFVLVCERDGLPLRFRTAEWRLLARGVEPPERAKPWLLMNRYYEIYQFER